MTSNYVLVIDDDDGIRESVVEILAEASIDAYGAGTGAAALRIAADRAPTVAVVDYRLPDMTGIEVVERLKGADPQLPVIIITGFATLQTAVSAVSVVDEYLTKPVRPERVVASVRAMLERRRLDAENVELGGRLARAQARVQQVLADSEQELAVFVDLLRASWSPALSDAEASARLTRMLASVRDRLAAVAVAVYRSVDERADRSLRLQAAVGEWEAPAVLPSPAERLVHDLLGRPARWATLVPVEEAGRLTGAILLAEAGFGSPRLLRALAAAVAPALGSAQPSASPLPPPATAEPVLLPGPREVAARPAECG